MDRDLTNSHYAHWRSVGYDHNSAELMAMAESDLTKSTLQLVEWSERYGLASNDDDFITEDCVTLSGLHDAMLSDDMLRKKWTMFIAALSSAATNSKVGVFLSLSYVQLDGDIIPTALRGAFRMSPIQRLILDHILGDAVKFACDALEMNHQLELLSMSTVRCDESISDTVTFVDKVSNHPRLRYIVITDCRLGQNKEVMSAIIPILCHVKEVCLENNDIGLDGARMIANCLATNPCVRSLFLGSNLLNDIALALLAASLKNNTNLRTLQIAGNKFSDVGEFEFAIAVHGVFGFDAILDSNHTCCVDILGSNPNGFDNPRDNKMSKLLFSIQKMTHVLKRVPLELMPTLLTLLQQGEEYDAKVFNALGAVFRVVCEFHSTLVASGAMDH